MQISNCGWDRNPSGYMWCEELMNSLFTCLLVYFYVTLILKQVFSTLVSVHKLPLNMMTDIRLYIYKWHWRKGILMHMFCLEWWNTIVIDTSLSPSGMGGPVPWRPSAPLTSSSSVPLRKYGSDTRTAWASCLGSWWDKVPVWSGYCRFKKEIRRNWFSNRCGWME